MRVSHDPEFVLIANPKCASQSLRRMLNRHSDIRSGKAFPFNNHVTARRLKREFDARGWDWSRYSTFTTIRNPWDRMVSFWAFGRSEPQSIWHDLAARTGTFQGFVREFAFYLDDVVMPPPEGREGQFGFDIHQVAFSETGERLIEDILPVEFLPEYLPLVARPLGLNLPEMAHHNASPRDDYRKYYKASETVDEVARLFAPDIALMAYQFDRLDPAN